MSRKRSKRTRPADAATRSPASSGRDASPSSALPASDSSTPESSQGPSPQLRTWLSIWVAIHLLAIGLSFTSVVEPSGIHARLSGLVQPYLRPAHFAADDRPVYLAHGNPSEQPHQLQATTASIPDIESLRDDQWRAVEPAGEAGLSAYPGLAVSDRRVRWLTTAAMLAENEQPSLVAELLLPIVRQNPELTAIRIVRLPTDLSDINTEEESPYVGRVVRSGDLVSLVQLQPGRLNAQVIPAGKGSTAEGAGP